MVHVPPLQCFEFVFVWVDSYFTGVHLGLGSSSYGLGSNSAACCCNFFLDWVEGESIIFWALGEFGISRDPLALIGVRRRFNMSW